MNTANQKYKAAWYQRNKARLREKNNAALAAWRKKNPEKVKAQRRRAYLRNGAKYAPLKKAWRLANEDKIRATSTAWRNRNRDYVRYLARQHYYRNKSKRKTSVRAWIARNLEAHKQYRRKMKRRLWEQLPDHYLKHDLTKRLVPVTKDNLNALRERRRLCRTSHTLKSLALVSTIGGL